MQEELKKLQDMIKELKRMFDEIKATSAKRYLTPKCELVYQVAKNHIGQDVSKTQHELSCAEGTNYIVERATGQQIGGDVSTIRMAVALKNTARFREVNEDEIERGIIVIYPTGSSNINTDISGIKHGHVGIASNDGKVMSTNSKTGLWDEHLTLQKMKEYYSYKGGYRCYYYRILG